MIIQSLDDAPAFTTADGSTIRELLNAGNSPLRNQSLAQATLAPGQSTARHFHPRAEEIYLIQSGTAQMEIEGETRGVKAGDAVAIPNGARHCITNTGADELVFWCCCAPAYGHDDTVLVKS